MPGSTGGREPIEPGSPMLRAGPARLGFDFEALQRITVAVRSRADVGLIASCGVRSALTVPIVDADGEILGFFDLQNKAAGVPYDGEDVHLVSALAHHAAAALEARKSANR